MTQHESRLFLGLAALLVGLAGCGGGEVPPEVGGRAAPQAAELGPPQPMALEPQVADLLQNLMWPSGNEVVRSREEWARLWDRHQGLRTFGCDAQGRCQDPKAPIPLPTIDFDRWQLILMTGDTSPGTGQTLEPLRWEQQVVVVSQKFSTSTCADCFYPQVQQPYVHAFLLPKAYGQIRFERH